MRVSSLFSGFVFFRIEYTYPLVSNIRLRAGFVLSPWQLLLLSVYLGTYVSKKLKKEKEKQISP